MHRRHNFRGIVKLSHEYFMNININHARISMDDIFTDYYIICGTNEKKNSEYIDTNKKWNEKEM